MSFSPTPPGRGAPPGAAGNPAHGTQRFSPPAAGAPARLDPKRVNVVAIALVVIGIVVGGGAGVYGYVESRRTEPVVVAVRDVPYGRQIVADDLGVVDVPYYRPQQLAGITDQRMVIGQYAAREIRANDLIQPSMLSPNPPDEPVYPNGRKLNPNMVAVAYALAGVGPITDRDRLNIGFIAADPTICDRARADVALGTTLPPPPALVETDQARKYACRWMSAVPILYIDGEVAYLEMTPAQAHALRALQAANVTFWAERYGASSETLQYMDRLDAAQVTLPELARPVTETLRVEPLIGPNAAAIPGTQQAPILGAPTATAPAATPAPTATPATGGRP